ncbi:hypothetical protein AZE42_12856 [Rhizopogon vesiculosus]|uniref:Uncharacterized protein n=1 Tax=Rhizopogon vesiculosus TaxID=180088 RepID=A0A1J8PTL9_9AGAM|nr:hypothetical protein AZE42_12856 [Rhizopogon vesiculosus]
MFLSYTLRGVVKEIQLPICGKGNDLWEHTAARIDAPEQTRQWAKEQTHERADQEVFVHAVVLNPSLRVSCFAPGSPYRQFPKLWTCVRNIFRRFYGREPNGDFRRAFHDYVQCDDE